MAQSWNGKTLTKKQQKEQERLFSILREANEREKTDGLTVEERWLRHLETGTPEK